MSEDKSTPPHYDVEIPSRDELLATVKAELKPVPFSRIVEKYKLTDERQQIGLKRRLRAMERDGQLVYTKGESYGLPERMDLKKGRVIGHRDGFGFVQLETEGPDLFLPHHQMQGVMHGDTVLVKAGKSDAKGRQEARVVRVIEQGKQEVVGRYFVEQGLGFVVPDDSRLSQDIVIPPESSHGARQGQIVVAELLNRPTRRSAPVGRIKEVLGEHLAPGMEIEMAIREHGIPQEWSAQVLEEVGKIAEEVQDSDKEGRVDLRELPLITIDGEDARDFDDAVYCEPDGKGFRLWVAIADVSHYVRVGTELDREATDRGNSVYFPNHVIPMLPEKLSNGLCSLNPDVDRLCMVAEMQIGSRGKLQNYTFYPALMRSHARLTYTKVAKILEGDPELRQRYQHQLTTIEQLHALYKVLRAKREQRGAIDFDTVETRFIFNAQRKIDKIVPVKRNDAHMLIEECMIMANVAAAQFVEKHEAKALFRIHDLPDEERLQGFRLLLGELGITMPGHEKPTPADFSSVLDQVKDRPDKELIQMMLLRSLQQAVYSAENRGHFGLALEAYGHFTSPIRRYPDLILHRVIKHILKTKKAELAGLEGACFYTDEQLDFLGPHCSSTERRADEATRQVDEWLKCEYMQDHVGDEFSGVVSSVTNFGLFIRIPELMIDGLVHISELPGDYYHFDAERHLLIGEQSRKVFRIGDSAEVRVASVDLDERKINFMLLSSTASETELATPSTPKRTPPKGRGKAKKSDLPRSKKPTKGKKLKAKAGKKKTRARKK
ncbi:MULTISPECIES: ribonuclease R [Gammaproteobacteria]|uniref:ribonuclease R n=1 Tax=Gammaproteobacteria TaxID=1236 RepID=UPI000DD08481|nr:MULTISPECIES: ribonuclease R [Gammaproteobacteria]RTE87670.1 ribonuclease R [Aliidiomarina sp. B3213]TCZ92546.1 ribonuclease R [Lysobacter sp. N42]